MPPVIWKSFLKCHYGLRNMHMLFLEGDRRDFSLFLIKNGIIIKKKRSKHYRENNKKKKVRFFLHTFLLLLIFIVNNCPVVEE
jgi:hypothetical protein